MANSVVRRIGSWCKEAALSLLAHAVSILISLSAGAIVGVTGGIIYGIVIRTGTPWQEIGRGIGGGTIIATALWFSGYPVGGFILSAFLGSRQKKLIAALVCGLLSVAHVVLMPVMYYRCTADLLMAFAVFLAVMYIGAAWLFSHGCNVSCDNCGRWSTEDRYIRDGEVRMRYCNKCGHLQFPHF